MSLSGFQTVASSPEPNAPGQEAGEDGEPAASPEATLDPVVEALRPVLEGMSRRIADLEDAVAEAVESLQKISRTVRTIEKTGARRKQLKKLKKILDQLEVVDVGPEGSPTDGEQ